MTKPNIIEQIKQKADIDLLVNQVIKSPNLTETLTTTIKTDKSSVKFGCEKILRLVSEQKPRLIYPYFDFFVELLDSDNSFLKWGAIITISNLIKVDSKDKFEKIFEKYYAPILGPTMVTAGNIIGGSIKIAQAKPELSEKIVPEILKVEKAKYIHKGKLSPECKNIVSGDAIDFFETVYENTKNQKKIVNFVKKQLKNSRPSTQNRAKNFFKIVSQ